MRVTFDGVMLSRSPVGSAETALIRLVDAVGATGYRFVTPTPATHMRVLARPGPPWARDLRDVFGWSRPFRQDVVPGEILSAMRDAGVLLEEGGGFRSAVRLSTLAGMLFLHSSYPTTGSDAVFFGPDTYRFARAIEQSQFTGSEVRRAVDIGCGAGPGAAVVAKRWPDALVHGVDINPAALRLARANAGAGGITVSFEQSDLLTGLDGAFDLIVANPPYLIDPAERTYRHGGGPLGAGLSLRILDVALDRLQSGGTLLLYTGSVIVGGTDAFLEASRSRLAARNVSWTYDEIDPDVFGEELEQGVYVAAERIAAVLLTATRRD